MATENTKGMTTADITLTVTFDQTDNEQTRAQITEIFNNAINTMMSRGGVDPLGSICNWKLDIDFLGHL